MTDFIYSAANVATSSRAGLMSAAQVLTLGNVYRNSGTPEGSVTASYGLCIDETNKKLYEKVSGTGNTGWREISPSESGTWTPTLTNIVNVASSSVLAARYIRIKSGSITNVIANVRLNVAAISAGVTTQVDVSLPFASAFALPENASGNVTTANSGYGNVRAETTNDRLTLTVVPNTTSSIGWEALAMYQEI